MHYNFRTKYYFIDTFDTKNIDKIDRQTVVIFRNYLPKQTDEVLLLKIKKYCKKKKN
jgi:thiamine-phosphate pyrophosphorylase